MPVFILLNEYIIPTLSRMDSNQKALVLASLIGGIGLTFGVTHLLHAIAEFPQEIPAIISGALLPIFLSLLIVGTAYWIARRTWTAVSPIPIIGWFTMGLFFGVGLSILLIIYQRAEQVTLSDPLYVIAMFATYGGGFGLLLGWYDVQRRVEQARQQQEAERLEKFAGIVSHDLRNPLHVATARLELAKDDGDSQHLDAIENALERMEALIDDLLILAREGDSVSELEPVSLRDISKQCWSNVATGEASISIEASGTILADRQRLAQVLENLLANAIQHGGDDVSITVGTLSDGFFVADDGPGIPESERESVFESGYTTESTGVGIGLSIVRQICRAHGWDIRVTESDAGGARFEITGVSTR